MSGVNSAANRRSAALLVAAVAAGSLGACTFGPRPDAELLELAQQATADGRSAHADALYAEIERLCGVDEQGEVPTSCEVEHTAGQLRPSPAPLGAYLEAQVPEESVDLVTSQAIELASLDSSELPATVVTDPEDQELVRKVLRQEHAAVYGLEASRAFASDPEWVDTLVEKHEQRVSVLSEAVPDAPVAAAGYTFGGAELGDALVEHIEDSTADAWAAAAADATSPEGRSLLVQGAGRALQR